MKHLLRYITVMPAFIAIMWISPALAIDVLGDAKPAVQSFHQAKDSTNPAVSPSSAANSTDSIPPETTSGSTQASQPIPTLPPLSAADNDAEFARLTHGQIALPVLPPQDKASLQAQINQLNQNNLIYEQTTNDQLEKLLLENKLLKEKTDELSQVAAALQQQIGSLSGQIKQLKSQHSESLPSHYKQKLMALGLKFKIWLFGHGYRIFIYFFLVSLLCAFIWMLLQGGKKTNEADRKKSKQQRNVKQSTIDDDTEDEYDFMGTAEAIPAKLDLARAYLAMGEYQAVKDTLLSVIKVGNKKQQQEAQELLKSISV